MAGFHASHVRAIELKGNIMDGTIDLSFEAFTGTKVPTAEGLGWGCSFFGSVPSFSEAQAHRRVRF